MDIYKRIYHNLCESRSHLKEQHKYGSGLDRHHILPKHAGGTDEDDNYTYLTPREHIIAHWLLWKIDGKKGDKLAIQLLKGRTSRRKRNKVVIDGVTYESMKEACERFNKSLRTIQHWVKKGKRTKYDFSHQVGVKKRGTKVVVDGVEYMSKDAASKALGINIYYITKLYCS